MLLILLVITILTLLWFISSKNDAPSIDGPTPWPIIGNLVQIAKTHKILCFALHKLSVKYGPIFKIYIGSKRLVVISGEKELTEMMHNSNFDGRGQSVVKEFLNKSKNGGKVKHVIGGYHKQ